MNLEMLRRVSAGFFVLMMGVVAALPYQTTPPTTRSAPVSLADPAWPVSPAVEGAPVVAAQFADPARQPSFWSRTSPRRENAAAAHPMLVLDPEQAARPIPDIDVPLPSRLVDSGPRPSEMKAPSPPPMSPTFPDANAAASTIVGSRSPAPPVSAPKLWDAEMTPVPHRNRHFPTGVATAAPPLRGRQPSVPQLKGAGPTTINGRVFPGLRSHKIRDGDTLSSIAQRKLGNAARAMEVFEPNRNVLASPAVLPVGVTIVIPPPTQQLPPDMTPVFRTD